MIKANELRIGNYILCKVIRGNNKSIEPYPLNINMLAYCAEMGTNEIDAEPIPLTLEILEKSGLTFSTPNLLSLCGSIKTKDNNIILFFIPYNLHTLEPPNEKAKELFDKFKPTIRYVHQLQNLYFALTCEELEVNL